MERTEGSIGISWHLTEDDTQMIRPKKSRSKHLLCEVLRHKPFFTHGFESHRGNCARWGFCRRCGVGLSHCYGAFPEFTIENDE